MKRLLVFLAIAALAVSAVSASAQSLLINGSFEDGAPTPGWTITGGYPIERQTQEPQSGSYAARSMKGFYSGTPEAGSLFQTVALAGTYDVVLSGAVKRYVLGDGYAPHPDWGTVAVDLTVDGAVVQTQEFAADDTWHNIQFAYNGPVQSNAGVNIRWGLTAAGGGNKTFDVMLADSFNLSATAVPEPASMLALLGGLAGLVIKRRK